MEQAHKTGVVPKCYHSLHQFSTPS